MPNEIRNLNCVPGLDYGESLDFVEEDAGFRTRLLDVWGKADAWILGHVTGGVIWGKLISEKIILACDADTSFGPPLNVPALLDMRVFSPDQELRIWKTGMKLKGRLVKEAPEQEKCFACDEHQIFLSAHRMDSAVCEGVTFSRVRGPSGQIQSLPVDWNGKKQKYRLKVRHYFKVSEDTGMLKISESRLLDVCQLQPQGENSHASA